MLFSKPPDPDKLNILCFPYAGGNADYYNRWSTQLDESICLHPVHLPGRGKYIQRPLISSMELLITLLIDELDTFRDCRVGFLGTSMGGWIAFQLAQQLNTSCHPVQPECLIICSAAHPDYRSHLPDLSGLDTQHAVNRLGTFNPACLNVLSNPELAEIYLPILQADLLLCRHWQFQAQPVLNCPLWAYHGTSDLIVQHDMMPACASLNSASFKLDTVEGDHFFTERAPDGFFQLLHKRIASLQQTLMTH